MLGDSPMEDAEPPVDKSQPEGTSVPDPPSNPRSTRSSRTNDNQIEASQTSNVSTSQSVVLEGGASHDIEDTIIPDRSDEALNTTDLYEVSHDHDEEDHDVNSDDEMYLDGDNDFDEDDEENDGDEDDGDGDAWIRQTLESISQDSKRVNASMEESHVPQHFTEGELRSDRSYDQPLPMNTDTMYLAELLLQETIREESAHTGTDSVSQRSLHEVVKEIDQNYIDTKRAKDKNRMELPSPSEIPIPKDNAATDAEMSEEKQMIPYKIPPARTRGQQLSLFAKNKQRKFDERAEKNKMLISYVNGLQDFELESRKKEMDKLMGTMEKVFGVGGIGKSWYTVVDMDAFFASVEELDNPKYKQLPIAVGGNSMLSTCNYKAREFGVRSAMPGFKARKLCPSLIIIEPHFNRYREVSDAVMDILQQYDPYFVQASVDEAYLNISLLVGKRTLEKLDSDIIAADTLTSEKLESIAETQAEDIVSEIRNRIKTEVGITASAGISSVRSIAKICCSEKKPDGQTLIKRNRKDTIGYMLSLPVRKVSGIGGATEQLLNDFGITTMQELHDNLYKLYKVLTPVFATSLFYKSIAMDGPNFKGTPEELLHELGEGSTSYESVREIWLKPDTSEDYRKSNGVEKTFDIKEDPVSVYEMLLSIADDVKQSLRDSISILDPASNVTTKEVKSKNMLASGPIFTLKINFADFSSITRAVGVSDKFASICQNHKKDAQSVPQDILDLPEEDRPLFYFLKKDLNYEEIEKLWNSQQVALRSWAVLFPLLRCHDENGPLPPTLESALSVIRNKEYGSKVRIVRNVRKLGVTAKLVLKESNDGFLTSWVNKNKTNQEKGKQPSNLQNDSSENTSHIVEEGTFTNNGVLNGSLEDHVVSSFMSKRTLDQHTSDTLTPTATYIDNFPDIPSGTRHSTVDPEISFGELSFVSEYGGGKRVRDPFNDVVGPGRDKRKPQVLTMLERAKSVTHTDTDRPTPTLTPPPVRQMKLVKKPKSNTIESAFSRVQQQQQREPQPIHDVNESGIMNDLGESSGPVEPDNAPLEQSVDSTAPSTGNPLEYKVIYEDPEGGSVLISRTRTLTCPICGQEKQLARDTMVSAAELKRDSSKVVSEIDSSYEWDNLLSQHIDSCLTTS